MKEAVAKKHLRRMLRDFTPGSILHLLADLFQEDADEARQQDDSQAYERYKTVEAALLVMGMGLDAACPR
jgi:hypothetical protein